MNDQLTPMEHKRERRFYFYLILFSVAFLLMVVAFSACGPSK